MGWVKDFLYEDLRKLDAGSNYSFRFRGEHIPTLEEVLSWLTTTSLHVNIELKTGILPYNGIEKKVIDLLQHFGLTDRAVISSFDHYSVQRFIQQSKHRNGYPTNRQTCSSMGLYKEYWSRLIHFRV